MSIIGLAQFCARFRVLSLAFGPWRGAVAQRMAQDVPMTAFRATTRNFSEPIKELDAAMRPGRLTHDNNRVP